MGWSSLLYQLEEKSVLIRIATAETTLMKTRQVVSHVLLSAKIAMAQLIQNVFPAHILTKIMVGCA